MERERKSQERRSRERRERNSRERRGRSRSRDNNEREELEKVLQEKFVKAYKIKSEQARGRYETAIALERAERSTEVQSLIAKITALEAKLAAQASVPAQVPAKAPPVPAAADMYLQQYVNHNSWIKSGRFDRNEPIYEHPDLANTEWLINYYWDERPYYRVDNPQIRVYKTYINDGLRANTVGIATASMLQLEADRKSENQAKSKARREAEGKGKGKGKGRDKGKAEGKGKAKGKGQGNWRGEWPQTYQWDYNHYTVLAPTDAPITVSCRLN